MNRSRSFLLVVCLSLATALAHATTTAPPPKMEDLCKTWLGMLGSIPLLVELKSDHQGWVATLSNGAPVLYRIEEWSVKGYDLSFRLKPLNPNSDELTLSGTGNFLRMVLRPKWKFFVADHEIVLEDMAFVRKQLDRALSVFSDRTLPAAPAPK